MQSSQDARVIYLCYADDEDGNVEQIHNVVGVQEGTNWVNIICIDGQTHMLSNSLYRRIRLDPMSVEGVVQ